MKQTWSKVINGLKDSCDVSQIGCTFWCDADNHAWWQLCASFSGSQQYPSEYDLGCLHFL